MIRCLAVVCLLILPLMARWPLLASSAWAEPHLPDQVFKQESRRLQKIHRNMKEQQEKVQEAQQLERSILEELEKLDNDFQRQQENLEEMRRQMARQEELLANKEEALAETKQAMARIRSHLKARLRVLYTMGGFDLISVAFSSRTLPDLLIFKDSFHVLLRHDRSLFNTYRQALADLNKSREALELHKSLLNSVVARLEEEREKLDAIHEEKQQLLETIRTRKKLHKQAIQEMKKAESDLVATLQQLRQQQMPTTSASPATAAKPKKKKAPVAAFVARKGLLPPPVYGELVRRFGERQEDALHNLAQNGIVIKAADKSEVRAVFPGKVVFAAYKRGYGNMVIIDHGDEYYTVTARLAEIDIETGKQVEKGTIIGKAGDIATLFDEGIYFEIRHQTQPLDPLPWLAPNCLENKLTVPAFF